METFRYQNSVQVKEWGCHFDSMLELKYALSIQDEFEFLRSRIPIYYDPKTKKPTDYIRYNTKRYTPDFLSRHKITLEAFLVEVKPRAFEKQKQLILRTQLAEQYIKWKSFDWKFKIVYDDEIRLSPEQQQLYNSYYRYKREWLGEKEEEKKEKIDLPVFKFSVDNKKVRFIMFGNDSTHAGPATNI